MSTHKLTHNGVTVFTGTENECYIKLQRSQSQSADWAIKYEGWNVEPLKLEYIGTYKVYKVFRRSGRREILARDLTRDEAKTMVSRYPDSNTSMVVFDKQFTSDKYFKLV